uniref:Uncharacterized protein n=1 Tax=Anguilla anguilla TaxID=7936 RepID=A0A0E9X9H1_ANGAN
MWLDTLVLGVVVLSLYQICRFLPGPQIYSDHFTSGCTARASSR